MIKVTCSKCGRVTEAADSMAGQTLYCGGCQSPLRIAHASDPSAGTVVTTGNPLRMAGRNRSASGGKLCSHCGALMPEGEIVCSACGYDPKTGETVTTRFQRRKAKTQRIRLFILLMALAGVAAAAWRVYQPMIRHTMVPRMQRLMGKEPPPQMRECTPEEIRAARESVEAKIKHDYPMIAPYQEIVIELATRQVIRGQSLKSETNGVLRIMDKDGVQRDIPFSKLGELSRIRVDADHRAQFVEQQVRKMTAPRPVPPAP